MNELFFELIRAASSNTGTLSHILTYTEWKRLYEIAKKQALAGICFTAVQRLPEYKRPPEVLYLTWMAMAAKVQQRNETINKQCVELQKGLDVEEFHSCVLKGQCVASYYGPLAGLRQSGDIDVWISGDYNKTIEHFKRKGMAGKITANHMKVHFFYDTEVEVHPLPAIFRCPWYNAKFMKFCKDHEDDWEDANGYNAPSIEFNMVFLLVHMYQHTLREGIGLRQYMDYYYCLKSSRMVSQINRASIVNTFSTLGMNNFLSGVMYIMQRVFGLNDDELLFPANSGFGAFLLDDILKGGNFGYYNDRNATAFDNHSSPLHRVWCSQQRNIRFLRFGFWEIIFSPFWRLWHFCWMKSNGYR